MLLSNDSYGISTTRIGPIVPNLYFELLQLLIALDGLKNNNICSRNEKIY